MPLIKIEFDDEKVGGAEMLELSWAVQKIVSVATGIEDVFVYANSAQIKVQIAPIEIFVGMSAHKIKDQDELFANMKAKISEWKQKNDFKQPVNLTLPKFNNQLQHLY